MLKDITLGQYYPADSLIHRLDPRVKLLCTIIYLVSLFVCRGIPCVAAAAVMLAVMIRLSGVPFSMLWKGLKVIWILLIITTFFNLFMTPGSYYLVEYGIIKISDTGVSNAIYFAIRLIFLVLGTSIMTLTTTPNMLTSGMETGLKPLQKMGVPIHEVAMMMSIALRFIPILTEEAEKIMKAQKARGADFEEGGLIAKAKNMVPLLVPLFVAAFRRATDLAMAMEARCYHGGEGRTQMKPLHYERRDYVVYVVMFAYFAVILVLRIAVPPMIWLEGKL